MRWRCAALLCLAGAVPSRADGPAPAPPTVEIAAAVPDGVGPVPGFGRALLAELCREAGLIVRVVDAPPAAALADLDAGRVDVAVGPYPPEAGAGRRALAPIATLGDALLRRGGDGGVTRPADAAGKRLGVLGPAAEAPRLRAEAMAMRARAVAPVGGFAHDPVGELLAGRLAALVGPLPDVAAAALARPGDLEVVGPPVGPVRRLAPLLRADRPELAERLAAALGRLRADGRLAALQRRWFGLAFDAPDAPQPSPLSTSKP